MEEEFKRFEESQRLMLSNTIGHPMLASRLAQLAIVIRNNPNIKTKKQIDDFIADDLKKFSDGLKLQGCDAYLFIDKYIDNLKDS